MSTFSRFALFASAVLLAGCGAPKPAVPSLNPEQANALLNYNNKAKNWMIYVKKNNPACEYVLDLPDQSSHPAQIDLDHIVSCSGRPAPKEFDASVSFSYDPAQQRWVVTRFSS